MRRCTLLLYSGDDKTGDELQGEQDDPDTTPGGGHPDGPNLTQPRDDARSAQVARPTDVVASDHGTEIGHVEQEEVLQVVQTLTHLVEQQQAWSGLLPRPADFTAYPGRVQDRMLAWTDAWTIDESKRRDRRLAHDIDMDRRGSSWVIVLYLLTTGAAFILFLIGQTVGGGIMLAPPVLLFLGRMLPWNRNSSDNSDSTADA
ncbi:MAG: hypothetical protein Q8P38_11915 [Candidatus Nanopelagicales bacterium]|nr:hypothetical protein [Candidatus Nanopelagicales bacterium]